MLVLHVSLKLGHSPPARNLTLFRTPYKYCMEVLSYHVNCAAKTELKK